MSDSFQERVDITSSCTDCDVLPKVENAGCVIENNPSYQIMHNGIKVSLGGYHGHWMQEIISNLRGHHEPQEEKVFHEILKYVPEKGVMIELGSFWAYYSMWFQWRVRNSTNYMVEPIREKLEVGKRNFALNNMKGHFIHASIGDSCIKNNRFIDWDGSQTIVNQISVDEIFSAKKISHVNILHSDIQGAEFDMLVGADQALASNKIDYIFISTHGYCHNKCIKKLSNYGYNIICEHSIDESYSADGLIVAKSPTIAEPKSISVSRLNTPVLRKMYTKTREIIHSIRSNSF